MTRFRFPGVFRASFALKGVMTNRGSNTELTKMELTVKRIAYLAAAALSPVSAAAQQDPSDRGRVRYTSDGVATRPRLFCDWPIGE